MYQVYAIALQSKVEIMWDRNLITVDSGLVKHLSGVQKANNDRHKIRPKSPTVRSCPLKTSTVRGRGFVHCGQGGRGFFKCGRPHFLMQKTSNF